MSTNGWYKKGQRKRKKTERFSSSGESDEVSPQIRKRLKDPEEAMGLGEGPDTQNVSLMKQLKNDTVSELKNFLRGEFDTLDKKITKEVKELEDKIDSKIFTLQQKNTELEQTLEDVTHANAELRIEMECVKGQLHDVKNHCIANEQYSRKNNVKIFGMQEEKGENCREKVYCLVKEKLGIDLRAEQIPVAHRVRSFRKPHPMIVRFDDRTTKIGVMKARKKLKGTKISIGEDMCKDLVTVYNRVKQNSRVVSAWMWDGKVFIKDRREGIYNVWYGQSVDDVLPYPEERDSPNRGDDHVADARPDEEKFSDEMEMVETPPEDAAKNDIE